MSMIIDGTNGLTFPNSTVQASSGVVLQVVSVAKTDTFTTSSTSYVDVTGLSVSITPKFSTSKILVAYQFNGGSDPAVQGIFMQLVRNSTPIFVGDAAGSRPQATASATPNSQYSTCEVGGTYLDSPSTTSATTYKIQMLVNGGAAGYVNRSSADRNTSLYDGRVSSSITVMEVSG